MIYTINWSNIVNPTLSLTNIQLPADVGASEKIIFWGFVTDAASSKPFQEMLLASEVFFFQTYFVRTGKLHCRCRVFQRVCDGWWSKPKQLQRGRLPAGLSSLTCWRVSWCIGFQCFRGPLKHHCRKSSLISLPFLGFTISHCVKGTTDTEVFRSFSMSKYQVSVQVGNFFVLAQIHPEISWSKQQTFFFEDKDFPVTLMNEDPSRTVITFPQSETYIRDV